MSSNFTTITPELLRSRNIRFRKVRNGTAGGLVVRGGFTTTYTTFESENMRGYKSICEFLPHRKCRESLKIQTIPAYKNL